jgi:hypothetical protein
VSEAGNIFSSINQDMMLLSQRMDHRRQESAAIKGDVRSLLERFQELEERIMTLEAANCEKEGRIDTLESLVDSMSDQLCHCVNKSPRVGSGSGSKEDPYDLDLEYASDKGSESSYQTPPQAPGSPVLRVLRLVQSPPPERSHEATEKVCTCSTGVLATRFGDDKEEVVKETVVRVPENKVPIPTISNAVHGQHSSHGHRRRSYCPYIPPTHFLGSPVGLTSTKDLCAWYLWVCWTGTPCVHRGESKGFADVDCGQSTDRGSFNGFDTEHSDMASSGRIAGGHQYCDCCPTPLCTKVAH